MAMPSEPSSPDINSASVAPVVSVRIPVDLSKLESLTDQELADALKNIVGNQSLPRRPTPQMPSIYRSSKQSTQTKLREIQNFINEFQYNHTGQNYVKKRRDRGAQHIMVTAKELIREALPIQCVEAVFIAIYLTAELEEVLLLLFDYVPCFWHVMLHMQYLFSSLYCSYSCFIVFC